MKAAVLKVYYTDSCEYCFKSEHASEIASTWEEVTQEELGDLKRWINIKNREYHRDKQFYYCLAVFDADCLAKSLKDYKKIAAARVKEEAEKIKKKEESDKQKLAKSEARMKAKELKKLKELQKKYDVESYK